MPERNIAAENGMKMVIDHALKFDLIDVDPFGVPNSFFPDAFGLLDDRSFLFVTTGEMHAMRFDPQKIMVRRGVKASSSLKWARKFFRKYCGEIAGAEIIESAFGHGVSLHPVFMYDYYVHPAGVHRLGYYARRNTDASTKARVRMCLAEDVTLGVKRIMYRPLTRNSGHPRSYDASMPCKIFTDCEEKEMEKAIMQRLDYLSIE